MARPTASAPAKSKAGDQLSFPKLVLTVAGLMSTIALFAAGIAGMFVILDEGKTGALSQSAFGVLYWKLVQKNPYVSAFSVNGGFIGVFLCISILAKHREAIKQKEQDAASKKGGAQKENKKSK